MRGGSKLPLIFAFFLLITATYAVKAYAVGEVVTDPLLTSTLTATAQKSDTTLCMAIYGSPTCTYMGVPQRLVPGEMPNADQMPLGATPPTGLIPYYENVFFPRMIELTKAQNGDNAKVATLLNSQQSNLKEAEQFSNYTQQVRNQTVLTASKAIGRTESLCPEPSLAQSSLPLDIIARQIARQIQDRNLAQMSGSAKYPSTARGKVEYDKARVTDRPASGTCVNDGNDGTNKDYCPNANDKLANADVNPYTLMQAWALMDDSEGGLPQQPFSRSLAQKFIDNLFANRVFEPLPASLMSKSPLPNKVTQVLGDQMTYMASLATFQMPYTDELAERSMVPGLKATNSLSAALDAAGYTGDAKQMLMAQGAVSRKASEYIRFKVYQTDPGTIIKQVAAYGGASAENLASLSIVKQMMQLEMMYEIREEMKKTNLLLGAIGSVLSKPEYEDIRARIQSAQSDGNTR